MSCSKLIILILGFHLFSGHSLAGTSNSKVKSKRTQILKISDRGSTSTVNLLITPKNSHSKNRSPINISTGPCDNLKSVVGVTAATPCLIFKDVRTKEWSRSPVLFLSKTFGEVNIQKDILNIYEIPVSEILSGAQIQYAETQRQKYKWGQIIKFQSDTKGSTDLIYILNEGKQINVRLGPIASGLLMDLELDFEF